jgi:hypothetical protein
MATTKTKVKKARAAKDKILSKTLYSYVTRKNDEWVRTKAKQFKVSYSVVVDALISAYKTGKPIDSTIKKHPRAA